MQLKLILNTENISKHGYLKFLQEIEKAILIKVFDKNISVKKNAKALSISESALRHKAQRYKLCRQEDEKWMQ